MSSAVKLRILLDTTYLLPIMGVEVEGLEDTLRIVRELSRRRIAKFYYSPFSFLEVLGKMSKLEYDQGIVGQGFSAIMEEFGMAVPTTRGYLRALELKVKGQFRDLIDLLLYETAATNDLRFLTRDTELIEFLKSMKEDISIIIYERDLSEKFRSK